MNKSDSITNLSKALLDAQMMMEPIVSDANNPFYHSKYPSAGQVVPKVNKALNHENLVLTIMPDYEFGISALLVHVPSDEWIQSTVVMPFAPGEKTPNVAQMYGAILTYMTRRINLSIMNVVADEDDDGNSAGPQAKEVAAKPAAKPAAPPVQYTRADAEKDKMVKLDKNLTLAAIGNMQPSDKIRAVLLDIIAAWDKPKDASKDQRIMLGIVLREIMPDQDVRHKVCGAIFKTELFSDVPGDQIVAMINWLQLVKDQAGHNKPHADRIKELLEVALQ
jgi:hypothetical protein